MEFSGRCRTLRRRKSKGNSKRRKSKNAHNARDAQDHDAGRTIFTFFSLPLAVFFILQH
jgi:hypothetical protein